MGNTELRRIPINVGHEYFADTDGLIWRKMLGRPRHKNESLIVTLMYHKGVWFKLIKPSIYGKQKNYLRVDLSNRQVSVHRAVLMAFGYCEGCENLQVNHKNRNSFDNRPDNLEWATNKENCQHRFKVPLPEPYNKLRERWIRSFQQRQSVSDYYDVKATGGQLKYDVDKIVYLLSTTDDSMESIALAAGCSFRAVKYWQEKLKVKRPKITLLDKVNNYLATEDLTPKELASKIGVRVTSIHAVLRKRKV